MTQKIRHFRDILPSQSFNTLLQTLYLTQQKQTCIDVLKGTITQNKQN